MKITKSSTTEISFLVKASEASIHEQDFILITDLVKKPEKMYIAQVEKLVQSKDDEINGIAIILGEIDSNDFSLSPCRFPISPESTITLPPQGMISKIISYRGEKGIYLGDIITSPSNTDPFLISPDFLERHVLCVASTGAGKSYSVGVLLEELILKFKSAAVLLFDIHNEYWGLACSNDGKEVEKLTYEDYKPQGFHENILVFEKESLGLGTHFDLSRLRRLLDLTSAQENSLLNIMKEPCTLDELISLIQDSNIHSATRENLISKVNTLKNMSLFDEKLNFEDLIQQGQISIIRLDQFSDERKRKVLVNEMLNLVFKKKISGEIIRELEVVIVIEEAHRFAIESEILARIAREGRKFGLYEILISQRPGDLPDNIIANMNTLIALRIRSDKDINKIRLMEGISSDTVSILPHLTRGEALIVGLQKGTYRPIKIRVRPRLSKHVDPQEDQMPNNIPRYKMPLRSENITTNKKTIISSSVSKEEKSDIFIDIKPFSYKDLINLLTCKHILILHKKTGICIFELGLTMLSIDSQLVSGFLTAISGLFSELKSQKPIKERTIVRIFSEEIGDRAFEIVTVEGDHSITAIIMDRKPKYINQLKQRIREFVYVFEKQFHPYLVEFLGVIDHFISSIHLLDRFIGLSLLSPLDLNNYEGDIAHPIIYEIILKQKDQLAKTEGLFIEEIVNQCLLDSDYSYREIVEAIVTFFQEGTLSLKDLTRSLPSFTFHDALKFSDTLEFESAETPKISSSSVELGEEDSEENQKALEFGNTEIDWFLQLISEIEQNPLPDSLKQDISERDLIFESNIRIKSKSLVKESYNEEDLKRWGKLMTQRGFILDHKTSNPVNGLKLIMSTESQKIICSITRMKNEEFFLIIGEIE